MQSRGDHVRRVGWVQSSAMLVRREAAEQVDWLDPAFFVYSDETDFCRRLHDAGWRILFVPQARAVHHDQLSTDADAMQRRIVEFHRGRDLYFRKHRMPLTRALWRVCWTWAYMVRAAAATVLPRHSPRRYLIHARQQLNPAHGEGLRELAERVQPRTERRRPAASTKAAPSVEHADTAQLAAVGGALGSVLVLLARGRLTLLGGLVVLALAEAGLALSLGDASLDKLSSGAGAAAAVAGLLVLGAAAALLAARPALVSIAVLAAAPFRPPISFDSSSRFLVSIAEDGRLGRLLPLYFVLAAAAAGARLARPAGEAGAAPCRR